MPAHGEYYTIFEEKRSAPWNSAFAKENREEECEGLVLRGGCGTIVRSIGWCGSAVPGKE